MDAIDKTIQLVYGVSITDVECVKQVEEFLNTEGEIE